MNLEHEILINKFGQSLIKISDLIEPFEKFNIESKKKFLIDILFLISQSRPKNSDIEVAIIESHLKSTYTPCVLIKKGVEDHNLKRLVDLPENELSKSFVLLLNLFKIAYKRRFFLEKNDLNKWWYWDLSDERNIEKIKRKFYYK
jgi:hypothetical protein